MMQLEISRPSDDLLDAFYAIGKLAGARVNKTSIVPGKSHTKRTHTSIADYMVTTGAKKVRKSSSIRTDATEAAHRAMLPVGTTTLVFDTETSALGGLVIQIAYALYNDDGRRLLLHDRLLRLPPGEKISWGAYKIHKIKKSRLDIQGVATAPEMKRFIRLVNAVIVSGGRVVAHNARFDCGAINRTCARHSVGERLDVAMCFCTMRASVGKVPVRSAKTGAFKPPTNVELYRYLTNTEPTGRLHDAAADIAVTACSYFEGVRRRWW